MGNSCDKVKHFKDQNFSKLQSDCRKRGGLFEDPQFNIFGDLLPRGSGGQGSGYRSRGQDSDRTEIVWLRPGQICQNNNQKPEFLVGSQDRFDINQGEIGDCWLLASLSTLAETPYYMNQVVPPGQTFEKKNYQGIFRFRFFRLGDWHQVVVDDRLPTRNGKLIYLRSNTPNEFWAALLEKAYAKFYGSYAAIEGGNSSDAAVDFTGGIPQIVKVSPDMEEEEKQKLFDWLELCSANGALISASLGETHSQEARGKGLEASHAYTVSKVVDIRRWFSSQNKLIRLRNPHGAGDEWTGDWSDGSELWNNISQGGKEEMKKSNDGEFYMDFTTDFLKYFGRIDIVHLSPMRMPLNKRKRTRQFKEFAVRGKWISKVTAAGISNFAANPQYRFTLTNCRDKFPDCSVVISLTQNRPRKEEHSIGFRVYKLSPEEHQEPPPLGPKFIDNAINLVKEAGAFVNLREVTQVLTLPAGHYCIVPSTFHANQEAEFLLRLWVDNRWSCDLDRRPARKVADHQCCFVCCHFGGQSCGCCSYLCRRCQACCGCSTGACCSQDEGDFYQKQ